MQHRRSVTDTIVLLVERVAAVLLGLVTLLIFVSAIGRYAFAMPVPDAFDLSRLLLSVAVIWGFASLGFRGNHIKVDLLVALMGPRTRRILDALAWSILWLFTAAMAWKIGGRVLSQMPGGEVTMDLRLPHWPFLLVVFVGLIGALVLTALRIWLVLVRGESLESHEQTEIPETAGGQNDRA
jgi:TRAP-type C4-dicarboxylate transport system permease small subunit